MIIGVGAPCADFVFEVGDDIIKQLNVPRGDARNVDWDELSNALDVCAQRGHTPLITTGGSASNTIKGLAQLGNRTAFLGKIGDDEIGVFYKNTITNLGITPLLTISEAPTTQIIAFVSPNKQRSFLTFFGAGQDLHPEQFISKDIQNANLIHVEGYRMENFPYVEVLMKQAKQQGSQISLDVGCIRVAKMYTKELFYLLKNYVDVFFINEEELHALTGLAPKEGCVALTQYCPLVTVLNGEYGCWVGSKEGVFHCPTFSVTAVDSTGAGDFFASGFLHGHLRGYPLQECAWLGNLLGSTVVTVLGADIPSHKWVWIKEQMDAHFALNPDPQDKQAAAGMPESKEKR